MNRRAFLAGAATATVGTGAVLASGSFSQAESQRQVTIETVGDEDAYLKLVYDDQTVNCEGEIELVTLTNQTKEELTDIEVTITSGTGDREFEDKTVPEKLAVGKSGTVTVDVACYPGDKETQTVSFDVEVTGTETNIKAQDRSIELICDCPADNPVSFVAFCSDSDPVSVSSIETHPGNDEEPTTIEWETEDPVQEVVLYGGRRWYRFDADGATTGTAKWSEDAANEYVFNEPPGNPFPIEFADGRERRPNIPCGCGASKKVEEVDGSFPLDDGNTDTTEDEC